MKKFYFALVLTLFVLPCFAQNIPSYVPKDGLVGYWPFNGNANDESGNGNNGIVNGATLTEDRNGVANSAYNFEGLNNYIDILNLNNDKLSQDFTISSWINIKSFDALYPQVVNGDNNYIAIQLGGSGYLNDLKMYKKLIFYFSPGPNYTKSNNDLKTDNYYFITSVKKADSIFLFINGEKQIASNFNNANIASGNYIRIGSYAPSVNSDYNKGDFDGKIDEISIYNRALSEQEIAGLYTEKPIAQNIPSYVPKDGLVGYWPFNGNANDESGNGHNGIVNGATLTTDRNGNGSSSYQFQPENQFITFPTTKDINLANLNGLTISFWYKASLSGNMRMIHFFDETNDLSIHYSSYGEMHCINYVNQIGPKFNHKLQPPMNKWTNIIWTLDFNNKISSIYFDGKLVNVLNPEDIIVSNSMYMRVSEPNWQYNGSLDDIAIYNRAITEQEITALYTSTPPCASTTAAITMSDSTTFCQGGSAILTAAVTSASTPIYQWYNNDQAITNATQNNYKATTAGKYTVKVVDGACEAVSLPKEVTVNPLPTATISPSGNVSTICEGSTLTLVAEGGVNYKWNTGSTENKITVSEAGPYYADVINQFGCKSVVWQDVIVDALPTVTINNLKQIAFKNESAIQLEGTPKGGIFTGEGVSGNTFIPEKAALGKKAITYTYSTTNGCKGEAKGTILLVDSLGNVCSSTKYDTVTVTNNVTKYDTVIVNKTKYDTVIVPKTVTKYDTITVKNNVYDTVIVPKTVTKYDTVKVNKYDTITFTNTVTKYDTVIVNKTKYDTVIVPKTITKYDTVKVNTYDTITVTNSVTKYDTVLVNKYDTITFTNTVTKYDTIKVNKYDTITVTDTVSILKINFKLTTGIKANQMTSMSIYPNPTSDVLIIDASDLAAITGYSYRILDVLGKEVYNALVTAEKTEISLKTLGTKGIYVLHILDANKLSVQTKQIVLE